MLQFVGPRIINEYGIKTAIAKTYGCSVNKVELGIRSGELCAEIPSDSNGACVEEDDGK